MQSDFKNIWEECSEKILLYDINHGLQIEHYRILLETVKNFDPSLGLITHYGGEFYAGNQKNSIIFLNECEKVFNEMITRNVVTKNGDEFITSIAATRIHENIKNAGAYVYRYWTGTFRLVSTNYKSNAIVVIHVPAEKEHGMLRLFDTFISQKRIPSNETVYKKLNLSSPSFKTRISLFISSLLHKN